MLWAAAIISNIVLAICLIGNKSFNWLQRYMWLAAAAGSLLFWVNKAAHPLYDLSFRIVQFCMLAPMALATMEAYRGMAPTRKFWRSSDILAMPLCACVALGFSMSQTWPRRWANSEFEPVMIALGTISCFMAFIPAMIVYSGNRKAIRYTEIGVNAQMLPWYWMVCSLHFFGLGKFPEVGTMFLAGTIVFCLSRAYVSVRFSLKGRRAMGNTHIRSDESQRQIAHYYSR